MANNSSKQSTYYVGYYYLHGITLFKLTDPPTGVFRLVHNGTLKNEQAENAYSLLKDYYNQMDATWTFDNKIDHMSRFKL